MVVPGHGVRAQARALHPRGRRADSPRSLRSDRRPAGLTVLENTCFYPCYICALPSAELGAITRGPPAGQTGGNGISVLYCQIVRNDEQWKGWLAASPSNPTPFPSPKRRGVRKEVRM